MVAGLPPLGHLGGRLTQSEPVVEARVPQDILPESVEEVDPREAAVRSLLCDWFNVEVGRRNRCQVKGEKERCLLLN